MSVADAISRHPSFSANTLFLSAVTADRAQMSLSSVTDTDIPAENADAAEADNEMLSQIIEGYIKDPWFASAASTTLLDIHHGAA